MNYIVLDMEWNQPGYADATLCRNGVCMKNEIIQIGAVKLSEKGEKIDTFNCIVKPVSLTSMNKTIKQLTGITDEMISMGESFSGAIERFKEFCTQEHVFLIWGYDDIRILRSNLTFHGLDTTWLGQNYNLQMIFCAQAGLERRQYSLSSALEHFNISIDERLHDALNDAEYTALVCQHLDLEQGIINLKNQPSSDKKQSKTGTALVKRKFRFIRRKDDIWQNGFIVRPFCPICGEKMKFEGPKRIGLWRINIEGACEKDGAFMTVLKISETPQGTYSVNQQIFELNDKTRAFFEVKPSSRRRKRHSSRGKKKVLTSIETKTAQEKTDEL